MVLSLAGWCWEVDVAPGKASYIWKAAKVGN